MPWRGGGVWRRVQRELAGLDEGDDAAGLVDGVDAVAGGEPGLGMRVHVGVVCPPGLVVAGGRGEGADEGGDLVEGHGEAGLAAEGEVVAEGVVLGHVGSVQGHWRTSRQWHNRSSPAPPAAEESGYPLHRLVRGEPVPAAYAPPIATRTAMIWIATCGSSAKNTIKPSDDASTRIKRMN